MFGIVIAGDIDSKFKFKFSMLDSQM